MILLAFIVLGTLFGSVCAEELEILDGKPRKKCKVVFI
jgi:hypothetical protein